MDRINHATPRDSRRRLARRELFQKFEQRYGSVLCKDVRKKAEGGCPEVVGRTAKWTAQILVEEFGAEGIGLLEEDP